MKKGLLAVALLALSIPVFGQDSVTCVTSWDGRTTRCANDVYGLPAFGLSASPFLPIFSVPYLSPPAPSNSSQRQAEAESRARQDQIDAEWKGRKKADKKFIKDCKVSGQCAQNEHGRYYYGASMAELEARAHREMCRDHKLPAEKCADAE